MAQEAFWAKHIIDGLRSTNNHSSSYQGNGGSNGDGKAHHSSKLNIQMNNNGTSMKTKSNQNNKTNGSGFVTSSNNNKSNNALVGALNITK